MNILILAAGEARPASGVHGYPTWLSEVDGSLILERQVEALKTLAPSRFVFMFRQADIDQYFLRDIVEQVAPGSAVIGVRRDTAGAACTALLASGEIDMESDLVVASATDQIDVDYPSVVAGFRARGADAGVLSFNALHPRYSYVVIDDEDWVIESAEKRPISRNASTGLYWFARAKDFFIGTQEMILKDAHVQGSFYICPVLNELILSQKRIAVHKLCADQYHPVKSDKQVDHFERLFEEGQAQ